MSILVYLESEQTIVASSSELASSETPIISITDMVEPSPVFSREEEEEEEDKSEEHIVFTPLPPFSSSDPSSPNANLTNESLPSPLEINRVSDLSGSDNASAQSRNGATPPTSPTNWRRAPSYEQLDQIAPEAATDIHPEPDQFKTRSNSSDHLSRPQILTSSIKKSLTLSISGSEAESIYGV